MAYVVLLFSRWHIVATTHHHDHHLMYNVRGSSEMLRFTNVSRKMPVSRSWNQSFESTWPANTICTRAIDT